MTQNSCKLVFGTKANRIFVEDPHLTSRAAYLLLKREYERQVLAQWEAFRNSFFDKHEPLTCFYCGKTNLVREITDLCDVKQRSILATIDHFEALSNGGSQYDESNCVVACQPCNTKKQSKKIGTPEFEAFIKNRINQNKKQLGEKQIEVLLKLLKSNLLIPNINHSNHSSHQTSYSLISK